VIATTAPLGRMALQRVAEMAHAGIARAIDPSHSSGDGDTVFALAVPAEGAAQEGLDMLAIGALAAHATARAIGRAVLAATSLAGIPAVRDLPRLVSP